MDGLIRRIESTGRRLRWLSLALIFLTPLAIVVALVLRGPLALLTVPPEIPVDLDALTMVGSVLVIALGLLKPASYLLALVLLHRLFSRYAQAEIFSQRNLRMMQRAGYVLISIDLAAMLQSALTGPLLTTLDLTPPHLALELQSGMLIVGFFVVLITRVMELGRALHEEERLTI